MTQVPAEERVGPLLPNDVEIDGMQKSDLLKVVQSHGLPVNDKMTAKELRPWARMVVHGVRKAIEHPGRLFHCSWRFDRLGRRRAFRRRILRSTSEETTNCAHHEHFFHHILTAEAHYFVHRPQCY